MTQEEYTAFVAEYGVDTIPSFLYTYGDSTWADLLTNYSGTNITYDELGNPLNWVGGRGITLTWENGRQLKQYKQGSARQYDYTYNADGLRTGKTVTQSGSVTKQTEYYIVNGQYIGEVSNIGGTDYVIAYVYDENGAPAGINVNGSAFYFAKNLQGDVTAILDYQGNVVANYRYDAYGAIISVTDASGATISSPTHIANLNPFRYRGYMYDEESGFYYLRSRYYDPFVGRFLNADNVISGTSDSVNGYNQFAYCFNNPVNMEDSTGNWPKWIKKAINFVTDKIVKNVAKAVAKTVEVVKKVREDIKNYDKNNESEEKVFSSNYFSAYKGKTVIKTPFDASFSCGIIGLSHVQQNSDILKHEYGHTVQLDNMGIVEYTSNVVVPSIMINILDRMDKLPYDYYSYPWEAEANELGGTSLYQIDKPQLPQGEYTSNWDLFKLFFE